MTNDETNSNVQMIECLKRPFRSFEHWNIDSSFVIRISSLLIALFTSATAFAQQTSAQIKVSQLIEAIDQKLLEMKSDFAIENRLGERVSGDRVISVPRNATMMEALEALAAQTAGTWYPWEKSIVVLPKEEQIRNLLNKTISVRYEAVDVTQVLSELSQRSGVDFVYEPGAIQRVPAQYRTIPKLVLIEVPIKQALESLAAFTGLGYVANEAGVYIWNATYGFGAGGGNPDPGVCTMQRDGGLSLLC